MELTGTNRLKAYFLGGEEHCSLYVESSSGPHEVWAALTEYIHLWWPGNFYRARESHIDSLH